ncbi:MAG: polysaccharide deacetylase family protein [Lentisphaerae bacterium]|jgi:hypothetical protein|nr:polysaccharide deacetylase family protein [Lentisphaerota bacterium]MBT4821562.1 polysaccharide deacetylase family protein [Lentisphaerota bacterium]MBT5604552.1 polysaccharide deacetylase family protein [Lentisphaerota bacterium]MBT7061725.1 polysaccharide deacetylase family protein [Lentisphaerota bacterium]MBT7848817.1 polysaccharide deacetylase family protein [Lentisphaerota bacterium]
MICLTGDVHPMSLQINDQKHISDSALTETRITQQYVGLLARYGVKATLYVCGGCFRDEWCDLEPVVTHPLVEVGGHMFNARFPRECFDAYGEQTGLWNGPKWFQDWDIGEMIRVAQERGGAEIVSWRAHSYMVDSNSHELLAKHGIKLVSDDVESDSVWPRTIDFGLITHPINVIPDHDHLYHAHRTPEYVEEVNRRSYGADDFGAVSYTIEDWGEKVIEQVERIDRIGGLATVLAHPLCHFLADGFATLEKILARFASKPTVFARDIRDLADSPPPAVTAWLEQHPPALRPVRYGPMGRHLTS